MPADDNEYIIQGLERALGEFRDIIDEKFRSRDDRSALIFKSMDSRVTEAKQAAVAAARGIAPRNPQPSPRTVLIRSLVARLIATGLKRGEPEQIAEELYKQPRVVEAIRSPIEWLRKAATNPAMTNVSGWAAELANGGAIYPGALATLSPASIYAGLKQRGISISLSGIGLRFPARATPGTIPNLFIGEGQPLPVRQISLVSGAVLSPHKAGSLSLFTAELARSSTPSIESVLRQTLAEDIGTSVDAILLGNAAATATQPAGLLNGITGLTPSAATDLAQAAAADISALAAAISPAASSLTFLMNSAQAASLAMLVPGAGLLDILVSENVPAKEVIAIDASDFASSVDGGGIDVTNDATAITRDDPAPVATGDSGAGAITAAPHQSLYQLDLVGIRILEDVSWAMRRAGRVAFVSAVKW